ncbi:MAG: 3-oxoacyl-[acyl-carrier-protein] reductase [Firmicutes bacterium]|jgi:3-oxoacyl-[acyl-carrier protein] reductase|nr:3-oxoacyl-[acyl-carrier-protein] reductase [Bacillota bacterium]HQD39076.1 3-oxoacyl-[acyl-carrier-protein] reductase [Bacillota bacterium]
MKLEGKVAVVTGAARGIGHATAKSLADAGAKVVICDLREEDLAGVQLDALKIAADVTDSEAADGLIAATLEKWGRLDIVVNNAGITRDNLLLRMKDPEWEAVLEVNLSGVFKVTRAAVRPMLKQRFGSIINISSVVGIMGNPGQANYAASKAGVIGFTKAVAREVAPRGIRVNAIAPGFIQTQMTDVLSDEAKAKLASQIPMGSLGSPEDVAQAVLFLASDQSRYITGQVLAVDGGMAM